MAPSMGTRHQLQPSMKSLQRTPSGKVNHLSPTICLVLLWCTCSFGDPIPATEGISKDTLEGIVMPGAALAKLAGGMQFVEGPVWLNGALVFSDIPANTLWKWSASDGLTVFRKPSGHANGNTLDRAGRLITCEHSNRRVSILEADGTVRTLVERSNGRRFNSPNDVVVKSDGSVWFTDPSYGLPSPESREQALNQVYRLDPRTGNVAIVASDFDMPNGLCFSPNEDLLYVSDSGSPRHVRVFTVNPDGTLAGGRVFCRIEVGVPDGIRCDASGRLYVSAADGVHVFSPSGAETGRIFVPETTANLCFGGPDGRTLFITASTSLYSIKLRTAGAGWGR